MMESWGWVLAIGGVLLLGIVLMALRRGGRARDGDGVIDTHPTSSPSYRAHRDLDDRGDADGGSGGDGGGD